MYIRACWIALLALVACSKRPSEVAPIAGGETMTFSFKDRNDNYMFELTLEKDGDDGYRLVTNHPDHQPEDLDLALDTKHGIRAFMLTNLWLPPSKRTPGAVLQCGTIAADQRPFGSYTGWVCETDGGKARRYYHPETGMLFGVFMREIGRQIILQKTTIAGMGG